MHATAVHDLEGQKDSLQVIGSCISSPVLLDCLPCLKSFFCMHSTVPLFS